MRDSPLSSSEVMDGTIIDSRKQGIEQVSRDWKFEVMPVKAGDN